MLARIESAYLGILRVVILIAATVALGVATLAIIYSAPYFISQVGLGDSVTAGNLSEFIEEQRGLGKNLDDPSSDARNESGSLISASLQASAKRVANYLNKHNSVGANPEVISESFSKVAENIPLQYHTQFEASLETLTKELEASKGTPLSFAKVDELIQWHNQRFSQSIAESELNRNENFVSTITAFGTAGGAFLVFVFLVFCFLFVRIERNLRIVRVASADLDGAADNV